MPSTVGLRSKSSSLIQTQRRRRSRSKQTSHKAYPNQLRRRRSSSLQEHIWYLSSGTWRRAARSMVDDDVVENAERGVCLGHVSDHPTARQLHEPVANPDRV